MSDLLLEEHVALVPVPGTKKEREHLLQRFIRINPKPR